MSRFLAGNLFLAASLACTTASQLLLKSWLREAPPINLSGAPLRTLLASPRLPFGLAGAVLLVAGFVCWMLSISRLDLAYAYPIACSSVLLVSLFGVLFLGETVTPKMWVGSALIVLGVILLMPSR